MLAARPLLAFAGVALLAACAEQSPLAPQPLPRLQSVVWHVNVSDGQPLPALLDHRTVEGNVYEQDFLDSAQFIVSADGTWEHRAWLQRFRSGHHYAVMTALDHGTWTASTEAYEFRRYTGELLYTLAGPASQEWRINLRYRDPSTLAVSHLRTTRPALGVEGRYRADAMNAQPLPYTYIVEPEFNNGTRLVSHHVIIDSAFVWIHANGSYRHTIFYSHWEGPVNGAPEERLIELVHTDFGSWAENGVALRLESGWLQNHVMLGERSANQTGPLRLNHGISHGDDALPLRYQRY